MWTYFPTFVDLFSNRGRFFPWPFFPWTFFPNTYGRASMGVPVGELQYGHTNGTVLELRIAACEGRD